MMKAEEAAKSDEKEDGNRLERKQGDYVALRLLNTKVEEYQPRVKRKEDGNQAAASNAL